MTDDTTKSAVETAEQVKQRVKKWVYKPPEAMSNYLWELFLFLSDHFTDSNSKAEVDHVGLMLTKIHKRRSDDPAFSAALDDYLLSRKQEP